MKFILSLNYTFLNYSSVKSKTVFYLNYSTCEKLFLRVFSFQSRRVCERSMHPLFSRRRPVYFILDSTKCKVSLSMFSSQLCSVSPSLKYRRKTSGSRLQLARREDAEEALERSGCNLQRAA